MNIRILLCYLIGTLSASAQTIHEEAFLVALNPLLVFFTNNVKSTNS